MQMKAFVYLKQLLYCIGPSKVTCEWRWAISQKGLTFPWQQLLIYFKIITLLVKIKSGIKRFRLHKVNFKTAKISKQWKKKKSPFLLMRLFYLPISVLYRCRLHDSFILSWSLPKLKLSGYIVLSKSNLVYLVYSA